MSDTTMTLHAAPRRERSPLPWLAAALLAALPLVLAATATLPWGEQWRALTLGAGDDFAALEYLDAMLPRLAMALLVGGALGVSGSLMQQLTRNPLSSPMTLGSASGAWLAMVLATILWPALAANHGEWVALSGALGATLLALAIAGGRGLSGLPVVLAGMALNLLFGALASALVMMNDQYTRSLFVWGAGDLAQSGWAGVLWLLPRLAPLLLLPLFARVLFLLRLGDAGAEGRGLSRAPQLMLFGLSLWLSAVAVAAVGLIGFVSLLTPHLARRLGARAPLAETLASLLLGALLLLLTDALAQLASQGLRDMVPSGAAAALIGAPALLWLTRSHLGVDAHQALAVPARAPSRRWRVAGALALALLAVLSLWLTRLPQGWGWEWPQGMIWELRWPRLLAALAGGAGLACAGVVLQRLLRNPLAGPDILGISSGATLALIVGAAYGVGAGGSTLLALAGSAGVLAALLLLGRRSGYAPGSMAITGMALAALLEGVVQFRLARGDVDAFVLLSWMAGSSYGVGGADARWLTLGVALLGTACLACVRVLTLVSVGDAMAEGRGLALAPVRLMLMVLVCALCALVTSVLGPIAFVGLMTPHLAARLGARRAGTQLAAAALLGMALMGLADWLGRSLIYPMQLPVGLCASLLCGAYFIAGLVGGKEAA